MAAPAATTPTLLPGKSVTLTLNVDVSGTPTVKTYAITTKNLQRSAEKIKTNNQNDNGAGSHIYGFVNSSGQFEMHIDSEDLPLFDAGGFYGAEWACASGDTVSGTIGLDSVNKQANPNGGYTLTGQYEFTGAVAKADAGAVFPSSLADRPGWPALRGAARHGRGPVRAWRTWRRSRPATRSPASTWATPTASGPRRPRRGPGRGAGQPRWGRRPATWSSCGPWSAPRTTSRRSTRRSRPESGRPSRRASGGRTRPSGPIA